MSAFDHKIINHQEKLEEWFSFLNSVLAAFSFSLWVVALNNTEYTESIATLAFVFVTIWAFGQGWLKGIKKYMDRDRRINGLGRSYLFTVQRVLVFAIPYALLFVTAFGHVSWECNSQPFGAGNFCLEDFSFKNFIQLLFS